MSRNYVGAESIKVGFDQELADMNIKPMEVREDENESLKSFYCDIVRVFDSVKLGQKSPAEGSTEIGGMKDGFIRSGAAAVNRLEARISQMLALAQSHINALVPNAEKGTASIERDFG